MTDNTSILLQQIINDLAEMKSMIQATRPDFLSIQDFAKQSGISVSGIRKMIADGRIKATKTGKTAQSKVLIPSDQLKRLERRK
jgi:excisionase family DNA binding protein